MSLEDVGGSPGLGEDNSVGRVDELSLDVSNDEVGLGVTDSSNLEGDVVGGSGLQSKRFELAFTLRSGVAVPVIASVRKNLDIHRVLKNW